MPSQPIDHALKAEVEAAVRAGLERKEIIARFRGKASLAALYDWIAKSSVRKAVDDRRGSRVPTAAAPSREPPAPIGLDPRDRLRQSFDVYDQILAFSRREDGTIKNARLAVLAAEGIRKNVQTEANLQPILENQEMEKHRQFCDDVIAVIKQEDPETCNRIFQRLRALVDNAKAKAGYRV
jgi:hypothetical protein